MTKTNTTTNASTIANAVKGTKENKTMNKPSKLEQLRTQVSTDESAMRDAERVATELTKTKTLVSQQVKHTLLTEPTKDKVAIDHYTPDLKPIKRYQMDDRKAAVQFIKNHTKNLTFTDKYVDRKGNLHLIIVGTVIDPKIAEAKAKAPITGNQVAMF